MIIIKGIMIILVFLLIPLGLGYMGKEKLGIVENRQLAGFLWCLLIGNVCMWGLFQLIAVPAIIGRNPLSTVLGAWMLVVCMGILVYLAREREKLLQACRNAVAVLQTEIKKKRPCWRLCAAVVIALIPIGYQCFKYVTKMHLDEDDSRYIAHAVDAYETGRMLLVSQATGEENVFGWIGDYAKDATSPWMIYLAMLSKVVRMHPAIFSHTVYAPYLLLLGYAAIYLIGFYLLQRNTEKAFLFTGIVAFLQFFFSGSTQTEAEFALIRIWQGKATLAAVSIPFILLVFLFLYHRTLQSRSVRSLSWNDVRSEVIGIAVLLGVTDLASCLMSGMGVVLAAVMIGAYGLWYVLATGKIRAGFWFCCSMLPSAAYGVFYYLLKAGQIIGV